MKSSIGRKVAAPVVVAMFAALAAQGCGSESGDGSSGCGADLEAEVTALGNATASLEALAAEMRTDLAVSCSKIAGTTVDPATVTDDELTDACAEAAAAIDAAFSASANASLTIIEGKCTVNADAQLSCEGSCQLDASCDPGGVEARCEPGKLEVTCEGECTGEASCEGSASASVACEGTCNGECTGTCEGTCNGTCEGTCSAENADGSCAGTCDGTCTGTCSATCTGECSGSCALNADAMVECEGELRCKGECSGDFSAPSCEAELEPPSCDGDADCQASCESQASLEAECTPPSIVIEGDVDAEFAATLQAELPTVLAVAAKLELAGQAALDIAELTVKVAGNIGPTAVQCAANFGAKVSAAAEASASVSVSVEASASVSGSASGAAG